MAHTFNPDVKLFDTFDEKIIEQIPLVDMGNLAGNTDYNDFVEAIDFPVTHRFIKFTDLYRRPSISCRYTQENPDTGKTEERVFTLFVRYTDNPLYWTIGGDLPHYLGVGGITLRSKKDQESEDTNYDENQQQILGLMRKMMDAYAAGRFGVEFEYTARGRMYKIVF
jgi:hypothetical protein